MATKQFVFGVDLDGVVADFYGGLRGIAAEWLGVEVDTLPEEVTYGLPEWGIPGAPGGYDELHRFAVTQRDLFRVLTPIAGAPQALRKLSEERKIRIRIITHRLFIQRFHQIAVQQTIEWLDHHDVPYWDLCFMRDKDAVGANLYIEDAPENVTVLRTAGHNTIVFSNSTNMDVEDPRADTWEDVLKLVGDAHDEWLRKASPK